MALVVLSVVEQRLDAVREVLSGAEVTEVACRYGVHRATLHRWVGRYLTDQLAGLADRSHRPASCPHQVAPSVEVVVAEMRRAHPRWGAKRIRMELLRKPVEGVTVPAVRTIVRVLHRQGLSQPRPRKRPRSSYRRFERPGPMQLWGIDIVGGIALIDVATGVVREAKLVTGVDDHSRYCVMAAVVERATGRAVCLAFAQALGRFGVPEEVITDNGKQFTDRFGRHGTRNGEVLFDKICRRNGITHRLTAPASPNQNGKVERFHGTFRPDFLDDAGPFTSVEEAQAAVDAWVHDYNVDRPHQALDDKVPVTPVERFAPVPAEQRAVLPLWLPPAIEPVTVADPPSSQPDEHCATDQSVKTATPDQGRGPGDPVQLERVVGPSGNLSVRGQQFWLGPARVGQLVRFWISCDFIHLSIGGTRVKTVRSHLSVNDLAILAAGAAIPAGPPPLPSSLEPDTVVEVERAVARGGTVALGGHVILAAEILGGRQVGIRIEGATLMFFDLDTRELLRTRPNPIPVAQWHHLRGVRPAGPPLRTSAEPITVQRRASNTGVITVCKQQVALGRAHAHHTVTVHVAETTLAIEVDGETRIVRRTTTLPVRNIKVDRPRTVPSIS
ncbi:IS481 family transposase [Intrasporangium calvum]|uniref:Integrase catalytic region n=1 Tax=Intrasporangium calvum (strain ATCC 23552 / DSM 43043 / JCM 3097 / NBRC 12989 / NCIMB 10167 / NRRL B-3866 / 7 KIP) TaxID=710696 RepID=E6SEJ6_INTC7|nr:Integrase catalytic region [Intrasporangium calvum DSM 43043]